ncbi:succinyldiaminopimelate transaminase [Micrococcoides hystricis]|uniref:Succinyldiaminopimelate transaminase n=1 Tax=Micrococcoides hystricis TaxID=1572761 RepID=A0ABV6P8E4_9MICC
MRPLPEYPWESLKPFREQAAQHPDGVVDLSIGTPADPTPAIIQDALAANTDAHGYPPTEGSVQLREAIVQWFARRRKTAGLGIDAVLPTVGSKELVAWLPTLLGLSGDDLVIHPVTAYPTYGVGADLADVDSLASDEPWNLDGSTKERIKLIWVNSPANPTGAVMDTEQLRKVVQFARTIGAVVASDECYAELGWDDWEEHVPGLLEPAVSENNLENLLAVYSMSKQSNMAGYRASFIAGDNQLIAELTNLRKHAGMMVPAPIQHALTVALGDDQHVQEQKDRYRRRRNQLKEALTTAGFSITHSQAGLYLWVSAEDHDCWSLVEKFAAAGIVVGPGSFYGPVGENNIRISLTASDEAVAQAVKRIPQVL